MWEKVASYKLKGAEIFIFICVKGLLNFVLLVKVSVKAQEFEMLKKAK